MKHENDFQNSKGLKIKEFKITPIAISDPPLLNAAGLHAPYALRTIVELITNDNISGISEIPGNAAINEALESIRELIIGQDPFQLNLILKLLEKKFESENDLRGDTPWDQRKMVHLFSAIEVACLDIIGKVTNRPIVDLLGGKVRERVPFAGYLFYKYEGAGGKLGIRINPTAKGWEAARQSQALNAEEIVIQAKAMCREFGFQSLKLKGGVFEPQVEVDTIFALRNAFPDTPLRFDPNAVWRTETALHYGHLMKPVIEYLEDPVRGQAGMALIKKELQIPIATNMCTTSFVDLPTSFSLNSEDIILSDHHFWGGLRASVTLSAICQTFGRHLSMHSNSHLGISLAAMVHLAASLQKLPYALDTHYPWQSEDVIIGGRFIFENGSVIVPKGPGLGVELDRVALKALHQNYVDCQLTARDDEKEMQKVQPNWKFQLVRW